MRILSLSLLLFGSGSPSKTLSSPAFVAENCQAHGKPLPISAGLSIMSQTEDKATGEFTPTGGFEFRQRCSPRKLNTAKKQMQAAKTAKAKHKPRSSAIRESMNQLYTPGRSSCENGLTPVETFARLSPAD